MKVSCSEYHDFLAEIKSKGVNVFERGGDYHSGYDVDTLTFCADNPNPIILAVMECSIGYMIYPDNLTKCIGN